MTCLLDLIVYRKRILKEGNIYKRPLNRKLEENYCSKATRNHNFKFLTNELSETNEFMCLCIYNSNMI